MTIREKRKLLSIKIAQVRRQINNSKDKEEREVLTMFMMDFKNSLNVLSIINH